MKKLNCYLSLGITMFSLLSISCGNNKKTDKAEENKDKAETISKEIQQAIAEETKVITKLDMIPSEYRQPVPDGGTIEHITYTIKNYLGGDDLIEKHANVYLPKGYDSSKKYSVLYLMHGIGGNENEWGMTDSNSFIKKIMDNLTVRDEITPFIIVTPNGRSGKNPANKQPNYDSFYKFGQELRNDLIPYMDSHYSTIPDRDHRAMAGLSMGGMQTINIGICECLDLLSWFGAFSAAPTSYPAAQVAASIDSRPEYPVNFFYNICGKEDSIAWQSHFDAARLLPRLTDNITEDVNYRWQERSGGHDFGIWNLGFYNFAKIFGVK